MPAKYVKFDGTGHAKDSNATTFTSKPQQQGIKRKCEFSDQRKQPDGAIEDVNGVRHLAKPVNSFKPNVTNHHRLHQQQPSKQPQPNGVRPSSAATISETHRKLLLSRASLPIHPHTSSIRRSLAAPRHVLILSGSTGSGKSTQVPQMLHDESWCSGGCIAITQPRRVAAISLAVRVAQEMGSTLGKEGRSSKVGYSVRFDENVPPKSIPAVNGKNNVGKGKAVTGPKSAMRIKYLTEGMLVQEIARDPWLKAYKAVIVDEVHERSVNVDLLLGFLRNILVAQEKDDEREVNRATMKGDGKHAVVGRNGNEKPKSGRAGVGKLKVVVMSATADTDSIFKFFEDGFQGGDGATEGAIERKTMSNGVLASKQINGEKPREKSPTPDSEESWAGFSSSDEDATGGKRRGRGPEDTQLDEEIISEHISTCHIEGRQYPVEVMYTPEPPQDFVEAALKTIFQIHYKEPLPGDILVFLTGQDTVESLEGLVLEHAAGMGPEVPKLLILPLFAALPQSAQQLVFNPTPPRTRKVILATNIAETSLTIPGIRHVIDCGLAKIKEYRATLALDSLLVKPISQSSAIQRKGRAGREAPGKCWRLYTEAEYLKLAPAAVPEILRCDLAAAVLAMKARGISNVTTFPLLDRPSPEAMRRALLQLHRLNALDERGAITLTGRQMARLPLPPQLARVLIAASDADPTRNVLLDMIDVVACLSVESVFLPLASEEKKEEAEAARRELYRREGDHLTLMAALQAYAAEESDRRAWCDRHFVSHRAMRNAMDVRKQLRLLCQSLGLTGAAGLSADTKTEPNASTIAVNRSEAATTSLANADRSTVLLRALLTGFAHNTARLCPDGSYKTLEGAHTLAIHPGSVLFGRKVEAVVYNELVWTTRCWARGVSAVRLDWWAEAVGVGAGGGFGGGFGGDGEK